MSEEKHLDNNASEQEPCEYLRIVRLTRCQSVEALDCALERMFQELFGTDGVLVMRPTGPLVEEGGSVQHIHVSSMENNIRDVVIGDSQRCPKRRYLDAILEVYGNQYELLLKNQVDKLTGLSNRQLLDEKISRLTVNRDVSDRRKNEPERIVAIFDIDHFKLVNDRFGHLYGDEVLVLVSHMMKQAFRTDDWLFRYGGEEFLVFLNNVDIEHGRSAINRFLHQVEAHDFPQIGKVTISCGYTLYKPYENFSTIFDRADKALYFAKGNGRNQSQFYEDLVANGDVESTERDSDIDLF